MSRDRALSGARGNRWSGGDRHEETGNGDELAFYLLRDPFVVRAPGRGHFRLACADRDKLSPSLCPQLFRTFRCRLRVPAMKGCSFTASWKLSRGTMITG